MNSVDLTCIGCPLGCLINVKLENGKVVSVEGNTCKKGEKYARTEVVDPKRIITSSVIAINNNGIEHQLSVKTADAVPKDKIFDVMDALKKVKVNSPVTIGDVVLANAAGTGVDIVATRNVK